MLTEPSERTHHDSRDRRPSHTSTDSISTFYSDASALPSPTSPDSLPDSPSSLPSSSNFPTPPHFVPSNVPLDTSPSKSPLPPPLLTSTFRPFDLLKVPFAHHTLKRFGHRSIRDMMEVEEDSVSDNSGHMQGEFVDLLVPDGISLRNFGVQVVSYVVIASITVS